MEAEADRTQSWKPAWSIEGVTRHPGLHRESQGRKRRRRGEEEEEEKRERKRKKERGDER